MQKALWPKPLVAIARLKVNTVILCLALSLLANVEINAFSFIRPPGTLVPGRPYVLLQMFSFFYFFRHEIYELPWPIAVKLGHVIEIWVRFIMQVQKFGGPSPQRNWGPKTCKIRRDFRQLQSLIANISGMGQDIENRKTHFSRAIPPAFNKNGELWSTNYRELDVSLNPPKLHFSGDYISVLRGCWPLKF